MLICIVFVSHTSIFPPKHKIITLALFQVYIILHDIIYKGFIISVADCINYILKLCSNSHGKGYFFIIVIQTYYYMSVKCNHLHHFFKCIVQYKYIHIVVQLCSQSPEVFILQNGNYTQ